MPGVEIAIPENNTIIADITATHYYSILFNSERLQSRRIGEATVRTLKENRKLEENDQNWKS